MRNKRPEEYLKSAIGKAVQVCRARGWGRDWKEVGTYLHLEASEFTESLRGKGGHSSEQEAAHILFVLFSAMGEHDVNVYEVWRILNQGLYDGWKFSEEIRAGERVCVTMSGKTLPERMRKIALDLPVPDDLTNREYWLRTEILEWADEVAVISGKLLAYEQREAGYELCEAHEGHWHPMEEMHLTHDGVWLCREAWDELAAVAAGG
jgi:hypothetical protein